MLISGRADHLRFAQTNTVWSSCDIFPAAALINTAHLRGLLPTNDFMSAQTLGEQVPQTELYLILSTRGGSQILSTGLEIKWKLLWLLSFGDTRENKTFNHDRQLDWHTGVTVIVQEMDETLFLALRLLHSMKLMLTVCISEGVCCF